MVSVFLPITASFMDGCVLSKLELPQQWSGPEHEHTCYSENVDLTASIQSPTCPKQTWDDLMNFSLLQKLEHEELMTVFLQKFPVQWSVICPGLRA